VNVSISTLAERPAPSPLWTAAALSLILHAALLVVLGSILTSAWRSSDVATAPGSGLPLQAVLAPRAADAVPDEPPPEPPVEVAPPAPPPPVAPPAVPAAPPMPPGLTQPGAGTAGVPRRPPSPPTDVGNIAVGATMNTSGFGPATATRLAQQYPVKPGRLPRLHRALTVNYPEWALRDRTSAHVDALLLLDAKGNVMETMLAPDDPIFGPAVREALAGAVFLPAQAADTTLPYWIALEFVFALEPVKAPSTNAN
jgi:hypothetical protein